MSTVYNLGPKWKGLSAIRRLVIFGDSMSSVEHVDTHDCARPTAADPLGISFPGSSEIGIWNEMDLPNWVGHFITKCRPGPRYTPPENAHQPGRLEDQSPAWIEHPLLVNNYAKGGADVEAVARQVQNLYCPGLGKNPVSSPWTSEDALFVTWVGVNDCAYQPKEGSIDSLFSLQHDLYITGARNFLLIDLPPVHRSPSVRKLYESDTLEICKQWNLNLNKAAEKFGSDHEDSSVFVFSAFQSFNQLLDDPAPYGLKKNDVKRIGGTIWIDHIHPTSLVHGHLAAHLAAFLFDTASIII